MGEWRLRGKWGGVAEEGTPPSPPAGPKFAMPLRFAFGDTFAPLPNNEIAFSRDSLIPGVFQALTTIRNLTF